MRKRPTPASWTKRTCPECSQTFKRMSDAMWKNVLMIHLRTDKTHGLSQQED
jgi:hypothetical protein